MQIAVNAAAAAGGMAARVATDRFLQWLSTPSTSGGLSTMGNLRSALPVTQPARGRGNRRGRGRRPQGSSRSRGSPAAGISTRSGSNVVIRDTEVIGSVTTTMKSYAFNPAVAELPRLKAHAAMYRRYRIKYFNIAYKSGAGMATEGNVTVGVLVGPVDPAVKDAATIMKLRPSFFTPAWKSASLTLGADVDLARYMLSGDATADGIAFTLYAISTVNSPGMIQVSYEVEFSHPHPF